MRTIYALLVLLCLFPESTVAQCLRIGIIGGIMVDACNGVAPGLEQDNEFIFLLNGPSPLNVDDIAIDLPNNTDINLVSTNDFSPNTGSASPVGGCFTVLDDGGVIPANAAVVIFMSNRVTQSYDLTSWCTQYGTVYILYKNQTLTTPTFLNTSPTPAVRNTQLFFRSLLGCAITYTYNVPTTSTDGNYYRFPEAINGVSVSPGPVNNGCAAPPPELLPVTLKSFSAAFINQSIVLQWSTATEINSGYFEIEKSSDGQTFTSIGKTTAAGNSNALLQYSFTDAASGTGKIFYRLRIVDIDGQTEYSKIVSVKGTSSGVALINVFAGASELKVEWNARQKGTVQMAVTDLYGRRLQSRSLPSEAGYNQTSLSLHGMSRGQYVFQLFIDGEVMAEKFVRP